MSKSKSKTKSKSEAKSTGKKKSQRSIDVEKLSDEQLSKAIDALSTKIRAKVDVTCSEINQMLERYGMTCRMEVAINTKEFFEAQE
jgi:hypothetical protein